MTTKAIAGCGECGWTSKPSSPAAADHAYRRHSCDRKRRRDELTARGRAREAAVDRTPRPCLHPRARHEHGERNAYVLDGCRCLPCAAAASAYELERIRRHAYGRWDGLVDAGPAREHARALMAAGVGWKRIAAQAGVSTGAVSKLLYGDATRATPQGPSKRIRPEAAARILAVRADLADGATVDGVGTARRLQALVCGGWSQHKLAARLGVQPSNFTAVVYGRGGVTVATARAVDALYEELWNTAPPAESPGDRAAVTRARRLADWRGWAPALAWDEDTIDDPAATPVVTEPAGVDEVAVLRRAAGDHGVPLTRPERWELVRSLHAQGLNDRQIATRTGLNISTVQYDRLDLGLPAVTTTPRRATA